MFLPHERDLGEGGSVVVGYLVVFLVCVLYWGGIWLAWGVL